MFRILRLFYCTVVLYKYDRGLSSTPSSGFPLDSTSFCLLAQRRDSTSHTDSKANLPPFEVLFLLSTKNHNYLISTMSLPQHHILTASSDAAQTIDSAAIVLYLPQGVAFDSRKTITKARSSWALYSRLHRMKKRHCPSASKSYPCPKRCKKEQPTTMPPQELARSRWESLPSASKSGGSIGSTTSPPTPAATSAPRRTGRRGNGRPTLPKRQESIEHSKDSDKATRKARVNQASSSADQQTLRSFRRSFQKVDKATVVTSLQYHGARCA